MISESKNLEDYSQWINQVVSHILLAGYFLTSDQRLWDTIDFLWQDDVSVEDAVEYILS